MNLTKFSIIVFCWTISIGALLSQVAEIKNSSGTTKIQFIPDGASGGGEFRLFAPDSTLTFIAGGNSEVDQGAFINMYRGDGMRTIQLDASHYLGGEFYLNNSNGQRGIHLKAHESTGEGSVIDMFDASNNRRIRLNTDVGILSSAYLNMYGIDGTNTAVFGHSLFFGGEFRLKDILGNDKIVLLATVGSGDFNMSVDGKVITEEVRVMDSNDWPDFVFDADYPLIAIEEFAQSIKTNGHMPGVPSAEEIANNGIDLGQMHKIQMEKIEELSLYIIELHERIIALEKEGQ